MLTREQIDYLFKFCEKHYVYFYELQTELVDHLANGIEEEMTKDKRLSFESALNRVYARFGIMGFSTFVREKQSQVFKKVRGDFFRLVLKQFRWPAVLAFALVVSLTYTVASWNGIAGMLLASITLIACTVYEFYQIRISLRFFKKAGKKFLMRSYNTPIGFFWVYIFVYMKILPETIWEAYPYSFASNPFFTAFFSGLGIVTIIASIHLDREIREKLVNDYPEVFQVAE